MKKYIPLLFVLLLFFGCTPSAQGPGNWQAGTLGGDPMIQLDANESITGYQAITNSQVSGTPFLYVVCDPTGGLRLVLVTRGMDVGYDNNNAVEVIYEFNNESPQTIFAEIGNAPSFHTKSLADSEWVLSRMSGHKTLVISFHPLESETFVSASFNIQGYETAIIPVEEACK
jgi:hypothetical protein